MKQLSDKRQFHDAEVLALRITRIRKDTFLGEKFLCGDV